MTDQKQRKKRMRSPEHPAFDLAEAVRKAGQLWEQEHRHEVPVNVAPTHWGYGVGSSSGLRAVAALIHFGLLEEQGAKEDRTVRLSQGAIDIILDDAATSPERRAALRAAALKPNIYRELHERWGPNPPSKETMKLHLQRDFKFNPRVVDSVIEDYAATLDYAGILGGETEGQPEDDLHPADRESELAVEQTTPLDISRPMKGERDLTIPLIGGGIAMLRVPVPLSEPNYDLILKTLDVMRAAIVSANRPDEVDDR